MADDRVRALRYEAKKYEHRARNKLDEIPHSRDPYGDTLEVASDFTKAAEAYKELGARKKAIGCYTSARNAVLADEDVREDNSRLVLELNEDIRRLRHSRFRGNLTGISETTAILGIVAGLFFLSANLTGNVIGLNQSSSNWIGGILFIIGLVGAFAYFRKK